MARIGCDIRTDEVTFILLTNKKNNNLFFLTLEARLFLSL